MPREPLSNIAIVHKDCASKPQLKYSAYDPKSFVGNFVKLGFADEGEEALEHMWVLVSEVVDKKTLRGVLDNDPVRVKDWEIGDEVEFTIGEIEDFLKV